MAVSDVHEAPANAVTRHSSTAGAVPALDAPLPFIMLSEDNTFEVTPEAVRFLQSIKGPWRSSPSRGSTARASRTC
ncbi:hypothetical protein PINS_up000538 [Pythium insidiosum]|nr:hypothetical protein PINS_up000538 [Pythium insidiosum]